MVRKVRVLNNICHSNLSLINWNHLMKVSDSHQWWTNHQSHKECSECRFWAPSWHSEQVMECEVIWLSGIHAPRWIRNNLTYAGFLSFAAFLGPIFLVDVNVVRRAWRHRQNSAIATFWHVPRTFGIWIFWREGANLCVTTTCNTGTSRSSCLYSCCC